MIYLRGYVSLNEDKGQMWKKRLNFVMILCELLNQNGPFIATSSALCS